MNTNSEQFYVVQQLMDNGEWIDATHQSGAPYVYPTYTEARESAVYVRMLGGYKTRIILRTFIEQVIA